MKSFLTLGRCSTTFVSLRFETARLRSDKRHHSHDCRPPFAKCRELSVRVLSIPAAVAEESSPMVADDRRPIVSPAPDDPTRPYAGERCVPSSARSA